MAQAVAQLTLFLGWPPLTPSAGLAGEFNRLPRARPEHHDPRAASHAPLEAIVTSAQTTIGKPPCQSRSQIVTRSIILGIDPGARGAVAVLTDDGDLIALHDMPAVEETSGRPATNAPLLAAIFAKAHASHAYVEFVGARPTDAKASAFAFGRARGVIEGVAGALAIPLRFITPPVWKRAAGVTPGMENKDAARARAIARWPAQAEMFARKKDVDRAEAALMGWAGLMKEGR